MRHFPSSVRIAALLALTTLPFAAMGQSQGVCSSQGYSDSKSCVLGTSGSGFRAATLTPSTQAPALAISAALSGGSGSGAPGAQRTSLDGNGDTGQAAAAASPRWNAWAALGQNSVGYDFVPAKSSGRVNLFLGGIDYTFSNNVIAGISYTDDTTRIGTQFDNGTLNGSGYAIAPYVAVPFGRNWVFDASVGWGRNKLSQIDRSAAVAVTGNTVDNRFFSSLALSYAVQVGKLQWTGKGMYLFSEDKVSQFTQSNNTVVPSTTTRVTQLRLGGQIAHDAGGVVPYAGLTYIYDLQSPVQPVTAGVSPANDRDAWQLALGVNFYSKGALSGGVQYSQDTSRKEVKNNLLMASIAYKF